MARPKPETILAFLEKSLQPSAGGGGPEGDSRWAGGEPDTSAASCIFSPSPPCSLSSLALPLCPPWLLTQYNQGRFLVFQLPAWGSGSCVCQVSATQTPAFRLPGPSRGPFLSLSPFLLSTVPSRPFGGFEAAARADDGARPPPPASFLTRSRVAGETGVGCEGLVQAAHADCSAATGPALVDAAPGAAERGLSRPTFSGFYLPIFFNSGQLKSQTLAVDMGTPLPLLSHARLFTAAVRRGLDLCRMLRSKVTKVVPCISFVFKHRGLYIYSVGYCLVSNGFFPPSGGQFTRHCVREKPFPSDIKCHSCHSAHLGFP